MRLLYSGAPECDPATLKRLMVLGKTLCFADRPSVSLGVGHGFTGTVGRPSPMRIDSTNQPIKIEVYEPPSGPAKPLYQKFLEADFSNPQFIERVVGGLRTNDAFAGKLVQLNAIYGDGLTGAAMRAAIIAMPAVPQRVTTDFGGIPFGIETREPIDYLRWLLLEASIQTTVTQLVAEEAEAVPVCEDPIMGQLLALRTATGSYDGKLASISPYLGIQFTKALIPDEVLQQLDFLDILDYRRATADAYDAWQVELDRIAAEMDDVDVRDAHQAIERKIKTELMPKVRAYEVEIASATDQFFGDLMKNAIRLPVPAMAVAYMTGHGLLGAAIAFGASTVGGVAIPAIDNLLAIRRAQRTHAVSYLVNLASEPQI